MQRLHVQRPQRDGLADVARIAILGVEIAMGLRAMRIAEHISLAFGLTAAP